MLQKNALIVIRTDGNKKIASGHIVRCLAIASCVRNLGRDVIFAVSDETSKRFVEERGGKAFVIGGDPMCLQCADGVALAEFAKSLGASKVLVDTYAVSRDFFCGLRERFPLLEIVYIDDGYNFKFGKLERPISWSVDVVINYSFGIDATKYDSEDFDGVDIYIGPTYAPIRPGFFSKKYSVRDEVKKVLVTSGSTNPKNVLETMVS